MSVNTKDSKFDDKGVLTFEPYNTEKHICFEIELGRLIDKKSVFKLNNKGLLGEGVSANFRH